METKGVYKYMNSQSHTYTYNLDFLVNRYPFPEFQFFMIQTIAIKKGKMTTKGEIFFLDFFFEFLRVLSERKPISYRILY